MLEIDYILCDTLLLRDDPEGSLKQNQRHIILLGSKNLPRPISWDINTGADKRIKISVSFLGILHHAETFSLFFFLGVFV
jgi:hypothetical protein